MGAWAGWEIQLASPTVRDGTLFLVRVPGAEAVQNIQQLKLNAFEKEVLFYPSVNERQEPVAEAIVGVPYLIEPGAKALTLVKVEGESSQKLAETTIEVQAADYASEVLSVDPKHVNPPASVKERIDREVAWVHAAYRLKTRSKEWKKPFRLPILNDLTSVFGTKRVYNGELKSSHLGVDVRAKVGTPIRAPEGGRVVLAKNLYYTGHTVLIDHGYGLITLYGHMSKRLVKEGQRVKRGDKIGLSGATGRVSGPHLHWGAILNEVKIDPMMLVRGLEWSQPKSGVKAGDRT